VHVQYQALVVVAELDDFGIGRARVTEAALVAARDVPLSARTQSRLAVVVVLEAVDVLAYDLVRVDIRDCVEAFRQIADYQQHRQICGEPTEKKKKTKC
jgi:uncharacterized protein (DUF1810 family)